MKTLFSLFGGAVLFQEQAGDIYLVIDGSLGGGAAAGIIEGQGKVKLGAGSVGLKLGEAWVNAHVPLMALPYVQAAEAYVNGLVAAQ
jgi:hypothetical protein